MASDAMQPPAEDALVVERLARMEGYAAMLDSAMSHDVTPSLRPLALGRLASLPRGKVAKLSRIVRSLSRSTRRSTNCAFTANWQGLFSSVDCGAT